MVLEELYSPEVLKKKSLFAFLLGISYAIIGMGAAIFLFPDDPALIAVAVTSMLMLPVLRKIIAMDDENMVQVQVQSEEMQANSEQSQIQDDSEIPTTTTGIYGWPMAYPKAEEKKTSRIIEIIKAYKVYILLFLGSFFTFAFFSMMLPKLAANFLFKNQLQLYFGSITGKAFSSGLFFDLFNNNLKVLMFCLIVSLMLGGGAIFIITWNASLWGTIFGTLAKLAATTTGQNQWILFGTIALIVFPHMLLEITSYIISAISGTILSNNIVREKLWSDAFKSKMMTAGYLIIISVAVLIAAMLVEAYVLGTFTSYQAIIRSAFSGL